MKLPAGSLKIILVDAAAADENYRRSRANGRIFKPTWVVWVVSGEKAVKYDVFSFRAARLTPRSVTTDFPFKWAPTALRSTRVWLETEGELDIATTQPEDI